MKLNNATAKVNGIEVKVPSPATTIGENTMVPLRFISETAGFKTDWDEVSREIKIVSIASQRQNAETDSKKTCTSLEKCIESNDLAAMKGMLGSVDKAHLLQAINNNNVEALQILLNSSYNLKSHTTIHADVLRASLFQKSLPMTEMLLNAGIDPNLTIMLNTTPLMQAVKDNNFDLVKLLLEKGADPNIVFYSLGLDVKNDKYTVIHTAYQLGYTDIYRLLKEYSIKLISIEPPDNVKITNKEELRSFLSTYYSKLSTSLGIVDIIYPWLSPGLSDTTIFGYDYNVKYNSTDVLLDPSLQLGMSRIALESVFNNEQITLQQKEEFARELKSFTERMAYKLISLMPDKKFTGGFEKNTTYKEKLDLGWFILSWDKSTSSTSFLSWTNYKPEIVYNYNDAKLDQFHWWGTFDSHQLTTAIPVRNIVDLEKSILRVKIGESIQYPIRIEPENATDVELEWIVDKPSIASVTSQGVVTGLDHGLTKIRIQVKSNPSVYTLVYVEVGELLKQNRK